MSILLSVGYLLIRSILSQEMLKKEWLLCVYAVLLMTGFNFLSHGSQDLYPTFVCEALKVTPLILS